MTRLFWLAIGIGSLVLALIGVILPLLPTTPFLLVSAYCFARSSQTLHDWLVEHPQFGPPIQHWRREGAIHRTAKVAAVVAMVAAFAISLALGMSATVLIIQAVVLFAAAAFVVTRPSPSPHDDR